eukprot:9477655-Lingulodinium_polyedra.AAC.1
MLLASVAHAKDAPQHAKSEPVNDINNFSGQGRPRLRRMQQAGVQKSQAELHLGVSAKAARGKDALPQDYECCAG